MSLPPFDRAPWIRADLEFEHLDHEGPSFVVLLYLNNEEVAETAGREESENFAGEFSVFGHGECWGDEGHCEVPSAPVSAFDRRPPHPLTPINISLEITAALRRLGNPHEVTLTALCFGPEDQSEPLRFKRLSLITYD
jgi:tyrosinase